VPVSASPSAPAPAPASRHGYGCGRRYGRSCESEGVNCDTLSVLDRIGGRYYGTVDVVDK
jgi:hypothetical protein